MIDGQVQRKRGKYNLFHALNDANHFIAQGTRFFIVGFSNAAIGLGIIYGCYNLLHINYIISNVIGYCCGLVNSFIWNKKWTFKSRKKPAVEIVFFLLFFLISYCLNLIVVIFFVEILDVNPNIAQLAGITLYTSTNFLSNKYVTFRSS
jgi:putative flippase GtrA